MAIPPINFSKFSQSNAIVDAQGRPTPFFMRWLNDVIGALVYSVNQVLVIPAVQAAIADAQAAAQNANDAAAAAQAAADSAQASGDQSAAASALANSYPSGATIMAEAVPTIDVSAHSRIYATSPPTTVLVNGGSVTGPLLNDTTYFIYYDQPSRAGGSVTYLATTNQSDVAQINNRHSVGTVTTPIAAGADNEGSQVTPPGGNYEFER